MMTKLLAVLHIQETHTGKATFLLLLVIWYLQINQQLTIKIDYTEN